MHAMMKQVKRTQEDFRRGGDIVAGPSGQAAKEKMRARHSGRAASLNKTLGGLR